MFLHGGFFHLAINMFVLWSFGNQIENVLISTKFLMLYFISGLVGGIFWMLLGSGPAVGASGALCGLMAAYIFIAPESKVLLFFIIPMKIKHAVYGFAAFSFIFGVLSLINPAFGFGIGHFAHLGGMIGGYFLTLYWRKKNLIPTF
jgi:membrane associated rhomboid family serine protease